MSEKPKSRAEAIRETLGQKPKSPPKPWICPPCGDQNPGTVRKCETCGTPKPKRGK